MPVSERPETVTSTLGTEVERLRSELTALKQQMRQTQRLASMGTMAAMVAHEFNNILTPVINYAQLAQRNPKLTEKALEKAAEGGKRACDICRALLGLAGRAHREPETFNLVELINDTVKAMARDPEKDQIELHLRMPENMPVNAIRVELQQVILNLLLNARQAVLERKGLQEIEICAWQEEANLHISIRDSGVGIGPEDLQKIFQPFFTTHADQSENGSGHGLGLAVCSEIVRSMGGDILVQSQLERGSLFTVVLPV